MKRRQFSKQNIKAFRTAVQKVLDVAAEECGATFHVGNITYSSQSCKLGVEAANILDGKVQVQEEIDFNKHALQYGFKKEDLFKTFLNDHGQQCTLIGLCMTRTKYPMQYRVNCSGVVYVTTVWNMKQWLGIKSLSLS